MTTQELLVIPLPKQVVFPSHFVSLTVRGRMATAWAEQLSEDSLVALAPSHAASLRNVASTDLHRSATVAKVVEVQRVSLAGGKGPAYRLTARGVGRVRLTAFLREEPFFLAKTQRVPDEEDATPEDAKAFRQLLLSFLDRVRPPERTLREKLRSLVDSAPLGVLADTYASIWPLAWPDKLALLDASSVAARIRIVSQSLKTRLTQQTSGSAAAEESSPEDELAQLRKKLEEAQVPEEQMAVLRKDLARLARVNPQSAERDVLHNYLEFAAELPWAPAQLEEISLENASRQLERDHCGLKDVKRRVLEYLAVLKLRESMQGPILCLMGPPGVGKSSIAKSVADALGRPFVRISLGGVSDESVIRGHRRTYVGAMPGRILDAMKRAKSSAPVILLDEIDKLGRDHRGDPSAALLEVLDPVQNDKFTDSYLNLPFDLSKVLFIATGNYAEGIPEPLKDRMEIIEVEGYSDVEKVQIAQKHLLQQQLAAHGMQEDSVVFSDESMLQLARNYTRESGVRNLTKNIASVVRYLAAKLVRSDEKVVSSSASRTIVTPEMLVEILGPSHYDEVGRTLEQRLSRPGVSTGLAWNGTGGGAVLFIEATKMVGKGELILTGQLGDVMRESCSAALSWIRSNAAYCGIPSSEPFLDKQDIHIHFPAGSTKKDGPSAGVAITVALVSLLTGKRVRSDCAMTGEMSLRGVVLPVGGIKEKAVAAVRNGVSLVFLPKRNAIKDVPQVSDEVKRQVRFVGVDHVEEVLSQVFEDGPALRAKM